MRISVIFLLPVLLMAGCGLLDSDDSQILSGELMPLEVGNWWEYQINRPLRTNSPPDTVREVVSRAVTVEINGQSYTAFGWNADIDFSPLPEYQWLSRNGEDGLYKMGGIAGTDTLFINEISYKLKAEVGDSWQMTQVSFSRSDLEFYISDTLQVTLMDTDRVVETPAGTFRCYVYHFDVSMGYDVAERFDYFMFYSPGVGMILQEERGQSDNRLISELVLIGYQVQ